MLSAAGYWALCLLSQHNAGNKGAACAPRSSRARGKAAESNRGDGRSRGAGGGRVLAMLAAAGGGQGRAEDAAAAEHKPALFPGGEPAWINRAVPSAESISLAGAPAGALAGSLPHLGSRAVSLLSVLASPAPASPGLRWDMHSFLFVACAVVCCRPAFSAASEGRGCSIAVLRARPARRGAGRVTAHCAHRHAFGGKRARSSEWLCLTGQSRSCPARAPTVWEDSSVSGRVLVSWGHKGQGSENTSGRCQQCRALPVIVVKQENKGKCLQPELQMLRDNLRASDNLGQMHLSVPFLRGKGKGDGPVKLQGCHRLGAA